MKYTRIAGQDWATYTPFLWSAIACEASRKVTVELHRQAREAFKIKLKPGMEAETHAYMSRTTYSQSLIY